MARHHEIRTPTAIHNQIIRDKKYKKYSRASWVGVLFIAVGVMVLMPMIAVTTMYRAGDDEDSKFDDAVAYMGPILISVCIIVIIVGVVIARLASRRMTSRYLLRRSELMNRGVLPDNHDRSEHYDIELVPTDMIMGLPSYEEVVGVEQYSNDFTADEVTIQPEQGEPGDLRYNAASVPDEPPPPYEESPSQQSQTENVNSE